jgi:hypothetical protein
MKKLNPLFYWYGAISIGAVFVRILYRLPPTIFNDDEAVSALVAKHILELKAFPIYRPYAHYVGMLSSYIGALFFKLFGISSFTWSLVGLLYSCVWIVLTYLLAKRILSPLGCLVAFIFVCLPSWRVLACSLFTGGVPAETLLFGTLLILLLIQWNDSDNNYRIVCGTLGFVSGFGLWTSPGIVPFILTIVTVAIIRKKKEMFPASFILFALFFCIGYLPGIVYNIQHPGAQLFRFAGRILDLDRSVLSSPDIKKILFQRIVWRISIIPRSFLRIPVMLASLVGVLPAALFAVSFALVWKKGSWWRTTDKKISAFGILSIFTFWFVIFYSVLVEKHPWGNWRYAIPLVVVMPIFIGKLACSIKEKSWRLFIIFVAILVLLNIYDLGRELVKRKISTYGELAAQLVTERISCAYADHWTAYPVQFESKEKVLLSPTLFDPAISDRFPEQTEKVRAASDAVFIIDREEWPQVMVAIENRLGELGVSYRKELYKEFVIYAKFSRRIYPEELNLSHAAQSKVPVMPWTVRISD